MSATTRRLLTIVTEAEFERELLRELERHGMPGYTITEARGRGSRGVRQSAWSMSSNIRVEIVCEAAHAQALMQHLQATYYENYAMIMWSQDVDVLRPDKFS